MIAMFFSERAPGPHYNELHERPAPTCAACAASAFMAWAVRGRSASVFGRSVWRGPRDRRALALTFDDGPSESTRKSSRRWPSTACRRTFFQCGANVDRLPEIARAVAAAGHEIGNHSYSHPYSVSALAGGIENELRRAQEAIEACTGARPAWFRAPFGARWFGVGRRSDGPIGRRDVDRNRL